MPKVGGHKDGFGGVVLHWLTQKGAFANMRKSPFCSSG